MSFSRIMWRKWWRQGGFIAFFLVYMSIGMFFTSWLGIVAAVVFTIGIIIFEYLQYLLQTKGGYKNECLVYK
tara:strand:+ start:8922 stop:9137 length:216 start_codon:yes stop_codon:yes gene_type:complete